MSSRLDYANSVLLAPLREKTSAGFSASKIHSLGLLLVTFSLVARIHPLSCSFFIGSRQPASNLPHCLIYSDILSTSDSLLASAVFLATTFSTPLQHQAVVGFTGPHNLCAPRFQRCCCPLSLELTPVWHSRLFVITYIPSSS